MNLNNKYIILVRHGELHNLKNIVYNRDLVMKKEDIIHLSDLGRKQLSRLSKIIKRDYKVENIFSSPETRAMESAEIIANESEKNLKVISCKAIDEVYASGPYLTGLKMDQWKKMNGDAYDEKLWGKFKHEKEESVIKRFTDFVIKQVKTVKTGEAVVLVSHGDPIALFINTFLTKKIPRGVDLHKMIYPKKGQGIVFVFDSQNNYLKYFILADQSLIQGKIY